MLGTGNTDDNALQLMFYPDQTCSALNQACINTCKSDCKSYEDDLTLTHVLHHLLTVSTRSGRGRLSQFSG